MPVHKFGRRRWWVNAHRSAGLFCVAVAILATATQAASEGATEFDDLFREYRFGDADRAVAIFADWSSGRVRSEAKLPTGEEDPWAVAALVLLHSEAEVHGGPASEQHFVTLRALGDRLDRASKASSDARLRTFCRDWFITQLAPGQRIDLWTDLKKRIPDDPLVQLALGARMEFVMPVIEGAGPNTYSFGPGPPVHVTSHGRLGPQAEWAMASFRRALELDSHLVEARLRLGRVLLQLDRWVEAERELRQARDEARVAGQPTVAHLAGLFLGHLLEERDRPTEALETYRSAVADYPAGQAARLALGRLLVVAGQEAEGWRAASGAMTPARANGGAPDPWTAYFQYQHPGLELATRLRQLRRQLRQ